MKSIIFIGTQKSGSSREAIKSAEKLGYYTILFTDRESFLSKREEFPDVHYMGKIDLKNIDEIKTSIKKIQMKGIVICSIISFVDPYCSVASLLAAEFGVGRFSSDSLLNIENKILSREKLKNSEYVPWFQIIKSDERVTMIKEKIKKDYPLIVKSPNSTGSKDVIKVNNYNGLYLAIKQLNKKYPSSDVLVEQYLNSPQYLVEVVVENEKVNIVAIFNQEIEFDKRFIVMGYDLIIEPIHEFKNSLINAIEDIVKIIELKTGVCHMELRYDEKKWYVIEINPRISGGAMNNIIKYAYGINLVEETLKLAQNKEINLQPKYKVNTFAQYVIVSKPGTLAKVIGKSRALNSLGVKEVYIKPRKGTYLIPPVSMGDRYAYVIANGLNPQDAKTNAKKAASLISFIESGTENKNMSKPIYNESEEDYLEYKIDVEILEDMEEIANCKLSVYDEKEGSEYPNLTEIIQDDSDNILKELSGEKVFNMKEEINCKCTENNYITNKYIEEDEYNYENEYKDYEENNYRDEYLESEYLVRRTHVFRLVNI